MRSSVQYAPSVQVTIWLKIKCLNTEQTSDPGFLNFSWRSHHWYRLHYSRDTIWNSSASTDIVSKKKLQYHGTKP